jgi:tetratricopeptide (TPR) repeat protein
MRYDRLGFPIPPEFDGAAPAEPPRAPRPAAGSGRGKRLVVIGLLAAVIGPGLLAPAALPVVREFVVGWSVRRAFQSEARGQSAAAIADVGRALAWSDDPQLTVDLLCWRALLRMDARDAAGAGADAGRAIDLAPASARPRRLRALVNVVLERPDDAVSDAEAAVELSAAGDPEALNHRAYVRALVGRDLPGALADVEAALAGETEPTAELLDTRGYVLHLLGRHQEAIDQLNLAIASASRRRHEAIERARAGDRLGAARELRSLDRDLAVMHHHRGLACRAVGLDGQAEQDFAIADHKGYDPSRGVM